MHVFALPTVCVEGIEDLIPTAHKRAVVGEITILVFLDFVPRQHIKKLLEQLLEEAVSHNYTYFNRQSTRPDAGHTTRFTTQGERVENHVMHADPGLLEVLEHVLKKVYMGKELQQIAYCYAVNADWENHEANGKMHKMRKLIGGL